MTKSSKSESTDSRSLIQSR
uniref:Uncharacterized protein n=1 Tax=Arundo donax TaxID=35708 RepID=A0A0A9C0U0_ARUDO